MRRENFQENSWVEIGEFGSESERPVQGGEFFGVGRTGLAWRYLPSKKAGIVDFPAISRGCATSAKCAQLATITAQLLHNTSALQ